MWRQPRYRVAATAVAIVLAALLVTGTVSQTSRAQTMTTLTFLGPDFDEWVAFVKVANEIGKPMGIQLKPEYLPWDNVFQKALVDSKSGVRTWDYVYVYNTWVPGLSAAKAVIPIDDLMTTPAAREAVQPQDFISLTTAGLEYNGKLWAMPMLAAPYMMGYRSDLFADPTEKKAFQAKYGYPLGVPQTYKQLMDTAQFFTRKAGQTLMGKPLDQDFYGLVMANKSGGFMFHRFEHILVAFGGDLVYDPKTMQPTVNSPQSIAAVKYYVALHRYMQPGTETVTGGGAERIMAAGRGAIAMDALDNMLSVLPVASLSKIVGKVSYAMLPSQAAGRPHANVADANGLAIYALTQHREDAFKFAAAVLNTTGTKQVMKEYPALIPMRRSVINDPEIRANYPNVFNSMSTFLNGKPYTAFIPPLKEWVQAQDIYEQGLSAAMSGQQSPEDAMNTAQGKVVELFKRQGYIK
jgi:multiple sugar transport system substrate-binding protein